MQGGMVNVSTNWTLTLTPSSCPPSLHRTPHLYTPTLSSPSPPQSSSPTPHPRTGQDCGVRAGRVTEGAGLIGVVPAVLVEPTAVKLLLQFLLGLPLQPSPGRSEATHSHPVGEDNHSDRGSKEEDTGHHSEDHVLVEVKDSIQGRRVGCQSSYTTQLAPHTYRHTAHTSSYRDADTH